MGTLRDEILAHSDPVDVVLGLLGHVPGRIERDGFGSLTSAERALFRVYDLVSEVDNGGFIQYFGNSSGDGAGEALVALRAIGAPQTAALLERVMAKLGERATDPARAVRGEAIAKLEEADYAAFEADNDTFYDRPEPLFDLVVAYCRAHADELHVEP